MTQGSTPSHDYARRAALTAAVDGAAAEVIGELANAGVRSILLKGRAFASWLYTQNELRSYGDVDLLLSPTDFSTAESVLAGLGFLRFPVAGVEHADTWSHESAHMEVELHRTLIGVSADPGRLWEVLSRRTEPLALGNTVVEMLDAAGRTLHVALHAAQHGTGGEKPLEDLARALNQVPRVTWECALSLGEELDATEAFAAGLRLMPEGERLATELQLSDKASPSTILMTGSPPPAALGLARVASTRGVRAKARVLARKLIPEPDFMRMTSGLARRGRTGLAASYGLRICWLAWRFGPALAAWVGARSEARSRGERESST